jgi:hypothetical protein
MTNAMTRFVINALGANIKERIMDFYIGTNEYWKTRFTKTLYHIGRLEIYAARCIPRLCNTVNRIELYSCHTLIFDYDSSKPVCRSLCDDLRGTRVLLWQGVFEYIADKEY